jgi:hypothetical protein
MQQIRVFSDGCSKLLQQQQEISEFVNVSVSKVSRELESFKRVFQSIHQENTS